MLIDFLAMLASKGLLQNALYLHEIRTPVAFNKVLLRPVHKGDFCCPTQCNLCHAEVATSCDIAILVQFVSVKRQLGHIYLVNKSCAPAQK